MPLAQPVVNANGNASIVVLRNPQSPSRARHGFVSIEPFEVSFG